MPKRRRTYAGRTGGTRPIDKQLIFVNMNDVNATQQSTVVLLASTACTVVGLRWSMFIEGNAGTVGNDHDYRWAIVVRRDGDGVPNSMGTVDGAEFYEPEQDVMAFGIGVDHGSATATTGANPQLVWQGKSSSKRKLLIGDRIFFICEGLATETVRVRGVVQLFCKT